MGESATSCGRVSVQNVLVMRHGDRIDSEEPLWPRRAERPWDPPLTEGGKARAWNAGKRLRAARLGFPIHRVLVSPFLRCLQTTGEVVAALCADAHDERDLLAAESPRGVAVDPSRVKAFDPPSSVPEPLTQGRRRIRRPPARALGRSSSSSYVCQLNMDWVRSYPGKQ